MSGVRGGEDASLRVNRKRAPPTPTSILMIGLSLALIPTNQAGAANRIAVLEFAGDMSVVRDAELEYLADKTRGAALKTLDPVNWDVMTRESLLVMLETNAEDLAACLGECEVETGRLVGADLVVTGSVVRLGETLRLTLKSFDTDTGRMVGYEDVSAANLLDLADGISAACAGLFDRQLPTDRSATPDRPITQSTGEFRIGDLGVEGLLAEQECTHDAEMRAHRERAERLGEEAQSLELDAASTWSTLSPQLEVCAKLEDRTARHRCALTLAEFQDWASRLAVSESAGVVEVPTDCGNRTVALEAITQQVNLTSILRECEASLGHLDVRGVHVKLSAGDVGSTPGEFTNVDLGVELLLAEQSCAREADDRARKRAAARLQAELRDIESEASQAWSALQPELVTCAKLEDAASRTPCLTKAREFVEWASDLEAYHRARIEAVQTSCGPREVTIPDRRASADVAELIESARLHLRMLERPKTVDRQRTERRPVSTPVEEDEGANVDECVKRCRSECLLMEGSLYEAHVRECHRRGFSGGFEVLGIFCGKVCGKK